MTEYQTLTLKETHEEVIVSTMEYPLMLAGVFYIKFIVYEQDYNIIDGVIRKTFYKPIKFITLQPQDILKRENIWSQEEEDMITTAAQEAKDRESTMAEYRTAAEEEMSRRVKEIPPQTSQIDDDDIDPEFQTNLDPKDPNYG